MANVIDAFVIELGLDPTKFNKQQQAAVQNVKQSIATIRKTAAQAEKETREGLERIAKSAIGLFALFTAGRGITEFVKFMTNTNAALGRQAYMIDANVRALGQWRGAVRLLGGDAQTFTNTVTGLVNEFQRFAITGQSSVIPYFRALGVQVADARGQMRPFNDILLDLADRFAKMDPARAHEFGTLLGLDETTIALLIRGRAVLQQYLDAAKAAAPRPEDVAAAQQLQTAMGRLELDSERLGTMLLTRVTPYLVAFLDALDGLAKWLQTHPNVLAAIAAGLGAIGTVITVGLSASVLGVAFRGLSALFGLFSISGLALNMGLVAEALGAEGLAGAFLTLGAAIEATPIGWILTGIAALGVAGYELIFHWQDVAKAWHNIWASMQADMSGQKGPSLITGGAAVGGPLGFGLGILAAGLGAGGGSPSPGASGAGAGPSDGGLLGMVRSLEASGDSAVSPKGAIGRYQVMPGTALQYGFDPSRLKDPGYNTIVASAILSDLMKRYGGDTQAALIAYNAGPGAANRWLKSGRNNAVLPGETQRYLARYGKMNGAAMAGGGRGNTTTNSRQTHIENIHVHGVDTNNAKRVAGSLAPAIEDVTFQGNGGLQ